MATWTTAAAVWIAIALGLWLLHRLGLWMEARGWIYYRKSGGGGVWSAGLLEVQKLLEPRVRHVIRITVERRKDVRRSVPGSAPPLDTSGADGDTGPGNSPLQ